MTHVFKNEIIIIIIIIIIKIPHGIRDRQLFGTLRFSQKFAGSITDEVNDNYFGRNVALGSIQPPAEMSTSSISRGWG